MTYFNRLFFIPLVFFVVQSGCSDNTIVSVYISEDVPLLCFYPKLIQTCTRVKWTKYLSADSSSKVILARPETPEVPDAKNIKWEPNKDGHNVLLLSDVKKTDEGVYRCEIWSGWVRILEKNVTLKVKECQSKVQKEPPGSPVALNCSEGKEVGVHNVSWSMLKGGNPVPLPKRFQENGPMLSIRSALAKDSGWYRCQYRLGDTQRCVDINLQLQGSSAESTSKVPEDVWTVQALNSDSGGGFTKVHTVAVIVGVVVIAALVGAVLYWKCKKKAPQETPEYQDIVENDVTYEVVADCAFLDDSTTTQPAFHQQYPDEPMATF